jgi:hypothetical protein
MNNKQYKEARELAESVEELDTFVSYYGIFNRANRYMKPDDIKEMRQAYKEERKENKAFVLEGFGNRALVIPTDNGYILKSYYTNVAEFRNGEFIRLWDGFSTTTLKHVNIFREFLGLRAIGKREWIELAVA